MLQHFHQALMEEVQDELFVLELDTFCLDFRERPETIWFPA